jgi:hypothetical protein
MLSTMHLISQQNNVNDNNKTELIYQEKKLLDNTPSHSILLCDSTDKLLTAETRMAKHCVKRKYFTKTHSGHGAPKEKHPHCIQAAMKLKKEKRAKNYLQNEIRKLSL